MEQNIHTGQIHLNTDFGQNLYTLAKNEKYKTFLEVGTWKGNGTTRCIVEGLLDRKEFNGIHFYSLESNISFYAEAFQLWLNFGLPFLHLCYGKLHDNGLMTRQEIESNYHYNGIVTHYQQWYDQDCKDYQTSPLLKLEHFPENIDVVLLDGGEFSGYADWLAVKQKNPKVVCLDDTHVMKNARVYKELTEDVSWEMVAGNANDRQGWAVFVRKPE